MSVSEKLAKSEQKFTLLGKSLKLLSEDAIPTKQRADSAKLVEGLLQMPKGKAIAVTKDEMGITPYSMKMKVLRLRKQGLLPKSYLARTRKIDGKEVLYIINSAKEE